MLRIEKSQLKFVGLEAVPQPELLGWEASDRTPILTLREGEILFTSGPYPLRKRFGSWLA